MECNDLVALRREILAAWECGDARLYLALIDQHNRLQTGRPVVKEPAR
jgi:hypothetical protein